MQRVLNTLLGLSFFSLGAFLVYGGTLRVYRAASVMADSALAGDAAGAELGRLLIGLLLAGIGFGIAGKGGARLRLAWNGPAAQPPAGHAAVAGPQAALPAELTLTHAGQVVCLRAVDGDVVLGRGTDCHIVVHSKYVSRHHARIEWDAHGSLRLVNLGQSGTSVRNTGETAYRRCDTVLRVAGEGDIALFADGGDAESRGDLVHFVLAVPSPAVPAAPVRPSAAKSVLTMGAIGLALLVGILVYEFGGDKGAADRQRAEMKTAMQEVQRSADAALRNDSATASAPLPPTSVSAVAKGDAGRLEAALKTVINRNVAQRQAYQLELDAIGWSRILDMARLEKDVSLVESKAILRQAHAIIARRRDGIDAHFAQMRRDVEQADLGAEMRRGVLKGVDESMPSQKARTAELWGLEDQIVVQLDKVFALLESRRKAWKVQKGKLVFSTQSDLDQFQAHLAAVDLITARGDVLRKSAADRVRASFAAAAK